MGASSTAQINQHLTNYASGLSQDLGKSLADFIAPPVPTGTANGQYKLYNAQNAFQVYNTRRAVGGRAKRIEFEELGAPMTSTTSERGAIALTASCRLVVA